MLVSMVVKQQAKPSVKTQNPGDLAALKALVETGAVTPVIDAAYPLGEAPRAMVTLPRGTRGTVVPVIGPATA